MSHCARLKPLDLLGLDLFADEVVPDVDVFRATLISVVLRNGDRALIVFVDDDGVVDVDLHLIEQILRPGYILGTERECYVRSYN